MWTLIIKKADSTVAGFMSAETTRENLGDYPEDMYDLYLVHDSLVPKGDLMGAAAGIVHDKIAKITLPAPQPVTDPKAIYAAAKTDSERIAIIAQQLGLISHRIRG
jgi:hypothetical protein